MSPEDEARAWAISYVERYCDILLSAQSCHEYQRDWNLDFTLLHAPVNSITHIRNVATGEILVHNTDYRWQQDGMVFDLGESGRGFAEYHIIYNAGYAHIPPELEAIITQLTNGVLALNAGGFQSETIGDYSYTYGSDVGMLGVIASVRGVLDLWRRSI